MTALPTTSNNGITGTWSPAVNSNATTTYTFTPTAGQCAVPTTLTVVVLAPDLSITKTAVESGYSTVGQLIHFNIVVTNTGPISLTSVHVTDPATGLNETINGLNPGEARTLTTIYTITQADINRGQIDNTASATYTCGGPVYTETASETVGATQIPALNIEKTSTTSPNSFDAAGDRLTYNLVVTNTGNVTLTNIVVSDPIAALASSTIAVLEPGMSTTITASYIVTLADMNRGYVLNTATASTSFNGDAISDSDEETINALQIPSLEIDKVATTTTFDSAGDILTYNLVVTNTGNVTLASIVVSDPIATVTGSPISSLNPGASVTLTATYVVTQNDLNNGYVINIATASTSFNGTPVTDSDEERVEADQLPELSITKTSTTVPNSFGNVGDVLTYELLVANTGNVSLTNITVSDPIAVVTGSPVALLNPGASVTLTATYIVTQVDIDRGYVLNTATASTTFNSDPVTDSDTERIDADQRPALTLTKNSITVPDSFDEPGDLLTYEIIVTNSGNVTLANVIVTDPLTSTNITIPSLVPGESRTITTTYTVTQADLNYGRVVNTATASATFAGEPVNASDSETVMAIQDPSWTLTKTAEEPDYDQVGELVHYTIEVVNTGNVSVSGVIVTDPGADSGSIRFVSGDTNGNNLLDPLETWTFTATHTLTQDNLDAGSYTNTATANGNAPSDTMTPATGSATVPALQLPELEIVKSTNAVDYVHAGEVITYTLTITNTGNVTITGITVSDPNATTITCTGAPYTLRPGQTATCTATHLVTLADVLAGEISNTATVTGTAPSTDPVSDNSNTVTIPLRNLPPSINCPVPVIASTSQSTCDALITGTEAVFSDPNDNVDRLTWTMTGATVATSPATGINQLTSHTFNRGVTTVTYTVTDALGLSASCSFTVTVNDNTPPVAICRDIDVYLDLNTGVVTITPDMVNNNSFDNCAVQSIAIDRNTFDCTNLGANTVTLTVTDESGNTSICTSVVTVHYAVIPVPVVTPASLDICDEGTTSFVLTNNLPATTWTWTVTSPASVTGASADNTGTLSSIIQTLDNSSMDAQRVTYTVTPRVYGACTLAPVTAEVWVNPKPEIRAVLADTIACSEEPSLISVRNPNGPVRGQWMYELVVTPDPMVAGSTASGTYSRATDLTEILINNDNVLRKVVYRFRPFIRLTDGTTVCTGPEQKVVIWVYPRIVYDARVNNISCFGLEDGHIRINISPAHGPYRFIWTGPNGYTSTHRNITRLAAGTYNLTVIDKNECETHESFTITEPEKIEVSLVPSLSRDGNYNIDCYGGATGSIVATAINTQGGASYRWSNGMFGREVTGLTAGEYRVIVTDANNCHGDASTTLIQPDPIRISYEVTSAYCEGSSDGQIKLTVSGGVPITNPDNNPENAYLFMWPDGSTSKDLLNAQVGTYTVTVTDANGCTQTATIKVDSPRDNCLIIPEAISVNDDGINDTWIIGNMDLYPDAEVIIYNRWGQELWRSERGYPIPWDGTSRGRRMPVDGYHYVIDLHNGSRMVAGSVTIVK
jgi:gliding motility-associated-like protein/uncharacterized repeat protein (TIGR01451 family)